VASSEFLRLLRLSRTAEQADAYIRFSLGDHEFSHLKTGATDLLRAFPVMPGACTLMSTLLAVYLEERCAGPAYVVAGDLVVSGVRVFGNDGGDFSQAFDASNASWDGHCWVVFGHLIVDVSVCRTAYSNHSPPALKRHLLETFGEGRGLLAFSDTAAREDGFEYRPRYILTGEQVDNLASSALTFLPT
jgi:hypothetical protein